jgi:hypothetical protein
MNAGRLVMWIVAVFVTAAHAASAQGPEATSSSPPPKPDSASAVTLVLRDGTTVRGRVTELRRGQFVNLMVASGGARTIAWDDIASSTGFALTLDATPAPVTSGVTWPLIPRPGAVSLRIESLGQPQIVGIPNGTTPDFDSDGNPYMRTVFSDVCTTPCVLYFPPGPLQFQTSGDRVAASINSITLPPTGATVAMRSPSDHRTLVVIFSALGGAILVAGISMFALGAASPGGSGGTYEFLGGSMGGVGLVALVAGLVYTIVNRGGPAAIMPNAASD